MHVAQVLYLLVYNYRYFVCFKYCFAILFLPLHARMLQMVGLNITVHM